MEISKNTSKIPVKLLDFSLREIKMYAYQIVLILEFLGRKGIVHRDLKFENFMLDEDFNLKLIDFGTAKLTSDGINEQLRKKIDEQISNFIKVNQSKYSYNLAYEENLEVGTQYYLPPEYITNKECTKMWDLWSFGLFTRHYGLSSHI
jgi:3-phosphoinositide dependent protein kinase-1